MENGSLILFALPVLLIVLMFTSQRKRQRAFANLQSALVPGQEIVTTSGLYARIVSLDDSVAVLEAAPGVQVRWDRRAIAGPAPDSAAPGAASLHDDTIDSSDSADPSDDSRPTDEK